jgi:DNA-binding winged helix-turn-helix (wHTH) protein
MNCSPGNGPEPVRRRSPHGARGRHITLTEVLTKSDLIAAAWQGAAVEEGNLSVQIAALRKLLGQSAEGGEWITTVPRVGYRFARTLHPEEGGATKSLKTSTIKTRQILPVAKSTHWQP